MEGQMVIFIFGIALTLCSLFLPMCNAEDDLDRIMAEFECKGLRGKTELETTKLLEECRALMGSGVMQTTKRYLMRTSKEERENARLKYVKKLGGLTRARRSVDECPEMNEKYLKDNSDMTGMRSISPYASHVEYNPTRFPKYIVQSYCLCDGCINPKTGRETNEYVSHSITASIKLFFYEGNESYKLRKENIVVGCTCVRPEMI